jgi:hypothetical protein
VRNLKGNLGIGFLIILVVAVFAPTLVHAKDYTVGVKTGDYIKYDQITFTWTGSRTSPSVVTNLKDMHWMGIGVSNVLNTTAILDVAEIYNNGTYTSESLDSDVRSPTGMLFLIASNLKAGDPPNPQRPEFTINQTVTRMYAGANRNVNIIDSELNITGYSSEFKEYWDQETGIMVELYSKETDLTNSSAYQEVSIKATETNLWSASALDLIQNNLIYIITGIAVIIAIVTATIVFRRRKPPSTQQPSPPPPSTPPPACAFPIQHHA